MERIEAARKKRLTDVQNHALNESLALLNELTAADCIDLPPKFGKLKQFLKAQIKGF